MNQYLFVLTTGISLLALFCCLYRIRKLSLQTKLRSGQQEQELQLVHALLLDEEKERARIASRLHDGVSGMVAAVKMHFSSLSEDCISMHTDGYRLGMQLLNEIAQEVRKTSYTLNPEGILQHGLDEGLFQYCKKLNRAYPIKIQYDSWGPVQRFTKGFELSVYKIVQELLQNLVFDAAKKEIMIQMTQQQRILSITIEAETSVQKHFDLHSLLPALHYRARQWNGKIEINKSRENLIEAYLEFETVS